MLFVWFPFSFFCVGKITVFGRVRKERENVINKGMMIRMGMIEARVLTGEEKTSSCLTLGGIL